MTKYLLGLAVILTTSVASAYPTSAVFTPTAEAKPFGGVGLLAYSSTNFKPSTSPGASWTGVEVGVFPQGGSYGRGYEFGGIEVGFDVISPFGDGKVKPVFNAKVAALKEKGYVPGVAIGFMEYSPRLASMNYGYLTSTKTLGDYGRVTLGLGRNFGDRTQFAGSFPFRSGAMFALMAAYESPLAWKKLGAVVDHFGGVSEVSSTYLGGVYAIHDTTTLGAGYYLSNDRKNAYDGFYAYLTASFEPFGSK